MKVKITLYTCFALVVITVISIWYTTCLPFTTKDNVYQIFQLAAKSGFEGTYQEWVESISGDEVEISIDPETNFISWKYKSQDSWTQLISVSELKGDTGLSAYDIWVGFGNDGDEADFLADIANDVQSSLMEYYIQLFDPSFNGTEDELMKLMYPNLNDHTVTFNNDGVLSTVTIYNGFKVTNPQEQKEGYKLSGWFIGDEKWSFSGNVVTEDIILNAVWVENEFDIYGSTYNDNKYNLVVNNNMNTINLNNYVTTNLEWEVKESSPYLTLNEGLNEFTLIIDGEEEILEIYKNKMFTVSFDTNNEQVVNSIQVEEGSKINTPIVLSKKGYTFNGWKNFDINNDVVTENLQLEALWTANTYTITFVNSNTLTTKQIQFGSTLEAYDGKSGYEFIGFNYNGRFISNNSVWDIASDVELEVVFKLNTFDITYELNGGVNGNNPKEFSVETIFDLEEPTKVGYNFTGWTVNGNPFNPNSLQLINMTLTANWEGIEFDIVYHLDGGFTSNLQKYQFSDTNILLENGVHTTKMFKGWYTDKTYTKQITHLNDTLNFEDTKINVYGLFDYQSNIIEDVNGDYIYFGYTYQSINVVDANEIELNNIEDNIYMYKGIQYIKEEAKYASNIDGLELVVGESYFFAYEPIKWLITSDKNEQLTLTTEKILYMTNYYNEATSISFNDSNINKLLNEQYLGLTSRQKELLKEVQGNNLITILESVEEETTYFVSDYLLATQVEGSRIDKYPSWLSAVASAPPGSVYFLSNNDQIIDPTEVHGVVPIIKLNK